MKKVFQKNIKNTHMKMRYNELFKVTHAKTSRLARSAMPNMQRSLNEQQIILNKKK